MPRRVTRPTKNRVAQGRATLADLPKMSETMLEFGKPLLDCFAPMPTLEELRSVMVLVTVAWNLPIYEKRKHPQAGEHRVIFDKAMAQMPAEVREIFAAMFHARLTTYAHDPRIGFAEVTRGEDGDAKIVAKAALVEPRG